MYQYKIVDQVTRKPKAMSGFLRIIMIIFGVIFVLMGIAISRGFMLPGFLIVLLYFVFDVFSRKEYEYVLEGTSLSIDIIYGKRYRKEAHRLELKDVEVVAPHWHDSVAKYKKKGGTEKLPKYDYTSYDDEIPYYTMIVIEDHKKIKLLLDLKEEMLRAMKTLYPEKIFVEYAQKEM